MEKGKDKDIKKEDFKKDIKSEKGFLNPLKNVLSEKQEKDSPIKSKEQLDRIIKELASKTGQSELEVTRKMKFKLEQEIENKKKKS